MGNVQKEEKTLGLLQKTGISLLGEASIETEEMQGNNLLSVFKKSSHEVTFG